MNFPKHTYLILVLYVHSVIAITLLTYFNNVTLYLHPVIITFLIFVKLDTGIPLVLHSLWFSWIQATHDGGYVPWVAAIFVTCSVFATILAAQLVAHSTKDMRWTVFVTALVGCLLMFTQAVLVPPTLLQLHIRTASFYFVMWMFETASRMTKKMDATTRRLVSVVLTFSILAMPLLMSALVGLGCLGLTLVYIHDITDDSEECSLE